MTTPAQHKYYGEQGTRYGGKLHWPGANGFPYVGDTAPSLKQHEVDALPILGQTYGDLFDLNDEESRQHYNWVRDRIRNGLFIRDHIDRRYEDGKKWPIIYLEWTQCYIQAPPRQATPGSNGHGSATQFTLRSP